MIGGGRTDRLPADVAAVIQPRHDVGQPDRVDVEDGGRVRIIADAPGIAGDQQQIAQTHRVRAQQVGLDAEQVAIAAGIVQDGLDARLLLHEHGERERADARPGAHPVGNVHGVDAADLEGARPLTSSVW